MNIDKHRFAFKSFCLAVFVVILSGFTLAKQIMFIQEETRGGVNWIKANYEGPRIPPASGVWDINFGITRPIGTYNPGSGTQYPLVVYLHGAGARGVLNNALDRSTARHFALAAINQPTLYNAFVLAGSVASSSYRWVEYNWGSGVYNQTDIAGNTYGEYMHSLELLLDYIINTDNNAELMSILGIQAQDIDLTRVYVVGDSMGAYGTWDLLARKPELFAAGITSGGSGPYNKTTELLQSAIWAIHGETDTTVPNYVPGDGSNPNGAGSIGALYWLQEALAPGTDWDGNSETASICLDNPYTSEAPEPFEKLVYSEFPNTGHGPASGWTDDMSSDFKSWLFAQSSEGFGQAPQITSVPETSTENGALYQYTVQASGEPAPVYTLTMSSDGMTIDADTGLIEWTSSAVGDYDVTVTASNGVYPDDQQSFTITVSRPGANIIFDSASNTFSGTESANLSWQHTIGDGHNRFLIVGLAAEDSGVSELPVVSVTYNGQALDEVPNSLALYPSTGVTQQTALYYMTESDLPSSGTYTIQVSYSGPVNDHSGTAVSLFNADQTAPIDDVNISTPSSSPIDTSVITSVDGCWLVDVIGCGNPGLFTPDAANMVIRCQTQTDSSSAALATRFVEFAGPAQMRWTHPAANKIAHSVAAIAPQGIIYGDINSDGEINGMDLGILASQWLQVPGEPSADIAPINGDMKVNLIDFAKLANDWMY